jgi:serine/threonine-protein kinase
MPTELDKAFAKKAIEAGLLTKETVAECLNIQNRIVEMGLLEKSLKEILLEKRYITEEDAARIEGAKEEVQKVVRVGDYEVLSRLGKGQMGRVYKARQLSTGTIIALKVLPPSLSKDRDYLDRFIREARAASKVSHPNIVSALDFGESEGLHYYAMEFVDGVNVRKILEEEGRIEEYEALTIVLQIASALEHAHSLSMIHRDIKPENIMLTPDGTAKLCDLGLAREVSEDSSLTQFGTVVGTPYYISPEQARGEKNPDIRSDIYSLGATLFHMVTGRVPFTGTTVATILARQITEEPPFASGVNAQVSPATSRLIRKMMEKNPARRYQNPTELIEEINGILSGVPVSVAPRKIVAPRRATHREVPAPRSAAKKALPLATLAVAAVTILLIIVSLSSRGPQTGAATPATVAHEAADFSPRATGSGSATPESAVVSVKPSTGSEEVRPVRFSDSEERLREITEFAKENPQEVARIVEKYREFIGTETDPDALKKARGILESLAAKTFISLQSEVAALSVSGDYRGAIGKVEEFEKMFEKTQSAQSAAELKNSLTESLQAVFAGGLKEARQLMEKGEFEKSLAAISALLPPTKKEQKELKAFNGKLKTRMKSAQKEKLAAAESTRDAFFAEVGKLRDSNKTSSWVTKMPI